MSLTARLADAAAVAAIRGYQRWLSKHTPTCPQTPCCSAYALAMVRRHGAARGLDMALARVTACGMSAKATDQ